MYLNITAYCFNVILREYTIGVKNIISIKYLKLVLKLIDDIIIASVLCLNTYRLINYSNLKIKTT